MNNSAFDLVKSCAVVTAFLLSLTVTMTAHSEESGTEVPPAMEMDHSTMDMDHSTMDMQQSPTPSQEMNHDNMDHGNMQHDSAGQQPMDHSQMDHSQMDHSQMQHQGMDHSSMQPAASSASNEPLRDPNAFSDGYTLDNAPYTLSGPRVLHLADEHYFGGVTFDRIEARRYKDDNSGLIEMQAFYGKDYDRLLFKGEGVYDNAEFAELESELLWHHAITSFWNSQLGVRHEREDVINRNWLALGVEGLAPYWVEFDATAYVGNKGRVAIRLNVEYDVLFSQKLILQPSAMAVLYSKEDSELGRGAGLSDAELGLRLRYEFYREFAAYIGVQWEALFGKSVDYAKAANQDPKQVQALAGVRLRF